MVEFRALQDPRPFLPVLTALWLPGSIHSQVSPSLGPVVHKTVRAKLPQVLVEEDMGDGLLYIEHALTALLLQRAEPRLHQY